MKYIYLNSERVIREFSCLNSGEALYFSNSRSHAAWVTGGREPVTGFHSVILRLFNGVSECHSSCYFRLLPRFSQPRQPPKYDDAKNTGRTSNQPVCHLTLGGLGEEGLLRPGSRLREDFRSVESRECDMSWHLCRLVPRLEEG